MVRYLNPGGYDFGSQNFDGYGISYVIIDVAYTVAFLAACAFLWVNRRHPSVQMRNIHLLLLSLLVLHVFAFECMLIYTLNGTFPCQVEFWAMSIYLPIGIGLFQAQNQQLLIVSQRQAQLMVSKHLYKPFLPKSTSGIGGLRYWRFRLKVWWKGIHRERKSQGLILIGFLVQFTVSFVIYNASRKFNHYGVVSQHVSPGQCRRGWEWAPTIIWQFLWNCCFGPYLIWKIRLIRDIYQWRLQTTIAIIAGLPGTPLWLAAVYGQNFTSVSKYWIPGMWFVPGIMTMEIVTLGFPIYQIFKQKRESQAILRALAEFDQKHLDSHNGSNASFISGSLRSRSTTSKRGKMYSMESLDETLSTNSEGLQMYASCVELNGENIVFLTRVLAFNKACEAAFQQNSSLNNNSQLARKAMFRQGLAIYVCLVHSNTAPYPINIESTIYHSLVAIFGPATALVAGAGPNRGSSIPNLEPTAVTPWDNTSALCDCEENFIPDDETSTNSYPMRSVGGKGLSTDPSSSTKNNESREHIVCAEITDVNGDAEAADKLQAMEVPAAFDERVFEAAFKSVRYMVWTGTWQRYQNWLKTERISGTRRAV
ncbi:hypothetical protein ACLMJK_005117 [Lecanora helva]